MSRILVDQVRSNSASSDALTLDGSGNITVPGNIVVTGNANCNGTSTGFGDRSDFVKLAVATGAGGTGDLIFDNLDVATYKTFDFTLICRPSTDQVQMRFRYRTGGASGSTITASHHQVAYLYMYNSNNMSQSTNMGIDHMKLTQGVGGNNSQEGVSLNMRISMCDANDNGVTKNRMNTVWWSAMVHNESLMPEWHVGNGTLTDSTSGSGGGAGGSTDYPTGFVIDFASGNVGNFSYQLYGLKR
tara:strand:+ start:508 stop:1239 length:732 start_codon:yes stop_codon:yes gene_type:complete